MSNQKGFLQIFLFALILILGIILFIFAKGQLAQKTSNKPAQKANLPQASIPQTTIAPTFKPTILPSILPLQTSSSSTSAIQTGATQSASPLPSNMLWCKDNTAQTDCRGHGGSV